MSEAQVQKLKHVPMRKCIATGEHKSKKDLLRFVRVLDPKDPSRNVVRMDSTGKMRGRGANITPTLVAFDLAVKKGAIEHNLKLEQRLSKDELEALREEFDKAIKDREFRQGRKKVTLKVSKEEFEEKLGR